MKDIKILAEKITIGYVIFDRTCSPKMNEIQIIYVDKEFRRIGVGNLLMKLACKQADELKLELCLWVVPAMTTKSNDELEEIFQRLKKWYRRFGFVENNPADKTCNFMVRRYHGG